MAAAAAVLLGGIYWAGRPLAGGQVVVYTSIDEIQARRVLEGFERQTGIRVRPVFDTEAAKTTGLALRILSETSRPRADVFWNNELSKTLELAKKGALRPYASPSAADIPAEWKDAGGAWAGSAIRARVIVYNSELVGEGAAPKKLEDLCGARFRGKVGIADPRFGTTSSHAGALAAAWGREKALDFFRRLKANGARVYQGNSAVRDAAASGEILAGLTDTDDVLLGQGRGMKIGMSVPDQQAGELGTLVIANTVSVIAGAPHPKEAERLVDYLLSREVEKNFAVPKEGWIPVREGLGAGGEAASLSSIKPMKVDWDQVSQLSAPFSAEAAKVLLE